MVLPTWYFTTIAAIQKRWFKACNQARSFRTCETICVYVFGLGKTIEILHAVIQPLQALIFKVKPARNMYTNLHDWNEIRELRRAVLTVAAEESQGPVRHKVDLRSNTVVPTKQDEYILYIYTCHPCPHSLHSSTRFRKPLCCNATYGMLYYRSCTQKMVYTRERTRAATTKHIQHA